MISPVPMPAKMKPGSSTVQAESASSRAISTSPIPTSASPAPIMNRTGNRAESFPATGATKNDRSVVGRNRRPACSGE